MTLMEPTKCESRSSVYRFWLRARAYLLVATFILLIVAAILVTAQFHKTADEEEDDAWDALDDDDEAEIVASMVISQSMTTLVTCFYTVSNSSAKSLQERKANFVPIAMLKLPLIVFADEEAVPFILDIRESAGYGNFTEIYAISLAELPLYSRRSLIRDVLRRNFETPQAISSSTSSLSSSSSSSSTNEQEDYDEDGDGSSSRFSRTLTDAVDNVILNNSRSYFIANATAVNPFNSTQFVWIDADYGDGNMTHFPQTFEWQPEFYPKHVTLIKMTPRTDQVMLYTRAMLAARKSHVIDQRFFAGRLKPLRKFHRLYQSRFLESLLVEHLVDDVEMTLIELIKNNAEFFNVVQGEWFSVFFVIN